METTSTQTSNTNAPIKEYGYLVIYIISDDRDLFPAFQHLDPAYDGTALYIKEEHEDQVAEICKVLQLNMDDWPGYNKEYSIMDREQFKQHCESIYADTQDNTCIPAIKQEFSGANIVDDLLSDATVNTLRDPTDEKYLYLFKPNSKEKLIEGLKNFSVGIKTGFKLGDHDIAFPGGAITVLAAPTNHGKTTVLHNLILGALDENQDRHIHLYTLEECEEMTLISLLNTWISRELLKAEITGNTSLSNSNKMSLASYYRGDNGYIRSEMFSIFKRYEQLFYETLIDNGRLKIHLWNDTAEELVKAIALTPKYDPKTCLIGIDYMQWLRLATHYAKRPEELKQICLMLKDEAIRTGFAIVLPAQFNREVTMESEMSYLKIGEAGDIERIANLIYGIYNRNFILNTRGNIGKDGELSERISSLYGSTKGPLYKNRYKWHLRFLW